MIQLAVISPLVFADYSTLQKMIWVFNPHDRKEEGFVFYFG